VIKRLNIFIVLILTLSVLLAACQPAAVEEPPVGEMEEPAADNAEDDAEEPAAEEADAEKTTVTFGDTQWQSLWINNAVAMFVVEHGYEYPVEEVTVTTPVMQQAMIDNEIQVMMEIWWANIEEWWNAEREAGTIVGLDPIFESSAQGYYVPRYVIEGDEERGIEPMAPDLVSVLDLPEYKELFADPEDPDMGVIVSCITGWNCAEVNRIKFYAYGLGETYNISEPGSAGALDAAIAGPYKKGEAVVSYYWEPTWLLGVYDMVMLEEPEYSDECWTQITEISETGVIDDSLIGNVTEEAGCAFENYAIPKAVSDDFAAAEPELTEFLNTMFIGTENLNEISAYMTQNEAEAEDAAIWYFQNYEDQWREWMPEDVAENVAEAVAAAAE
jgi:glycine betaine/proline transport system substrate-binding protein